ncbi:hypothetical protein EIN_173830 [Entamoeba invadens IP1]|uniref:Uncharacterized protein n=1 Tax=Entamoeba invadens IP1 TaxID=370355 RepID=A0A0A1U1C5_ENTIV|nr:hypothetical protein EIN_173830 [Entamoeba invadens IP1]ELP84708.1 hypothetical protein EIN_173830 [Entamoeba invadens IP1]|eukprot:XP_004184054.1 hypothetical protein EIN_173830 [Entamoeba invadens IP1]
MNHTISPIYIQKTYDAPTFKKRQTLIKRESTNREHLSNAAIIGFANVYGIDLTIRCPVQKTTSLVTYDHLTIDSIGSTEMTVPHESITRNEKKSMYALMYNTLSQHIITTNFLNCQLTKPRVTTKTQKLLKFKWIDPFNELGFYLFGAGVISIIQNLPKEPINKKQQSLHLLPLNQQIIQLFEKCVDDTSKLSENGKRIFASQCDSVSNHIESNGVNANCVLVNDTTTCNTIVNLNDTPMTSTLCDCNPCFLGQRDTIATAKEEVVAGEQVNCS